MITAIPVIVLNEIGSLSLSPSLSEKIILIFLVLIFLTGLFPFLFSRRNRRENHVDTVPLTNRDIVLREVKDKKEYSKKDSSNDVSVEQYSSRSTERI